MPPRTRNFDKKRLRGRKKEVRFPRREIPIRKSATVIRPPENYENLILYYLTKLKRLFSSPDHPQPGSNENSAEKLRREQLTDRRSAEKCQKIEIDPNKYTARRSTPKPHAESLEIEQDIKDKVYNVVNAAIEYGFANNVLEKKGDCFIFKNKRNSKIANRQPTPGPCSLKSYCSRCNCIRCKGAKDGDDTHERCFRPFSEHNTRRPVDDKRPSTSAYVSRLSSGLKTHSLSMAPKGIAHERRTSRSKSCTFARHNIKERKMCSCRRCRLLEQRRKVQKK